MARLPPCLPDAGLEQALGDLEKLRFSEEYYWLASTRRRAWLISTAITAQQHLSRSENRAPYLREIKSAPSISVSLRRSGRS